MNNIKYSLYKIIIQNKKAIPYTDTYTPPIPPSYYPRSIISKEFIFGPSCIIGIRIVSHFPKKLLNPSLSPGIYIATNLFPKSLEPI